MVFICSSYQVLESNYGRIESKKSTQRPDNGTSLESNYGRIERRIPTRMHSDSHGLESNYGRIES